MFFCLKTANAKMMNVQNFGLRLSELIISQVSGTIQGKVFLVKPFS